MTIEARLALPTLDHGVSRTNPAGDEILSETEWRFTAGGPSWLPFHRPDMNELLLKGT